MAYIVVSDIQGLARTVLWSAKVHGYEGATGLGAPVELDHAFDIVIRGP